MRRSQFPKNLSGFNLNLRLNIPDVQRIYNGDAPGLQPVSRIFRLPNIWVLLCALGNLPPAFRQTETQVRTVVISCVSPPTPSQPKPLRHDEESRVFVANARASYPHRRIVHLMFLVDDDGVDQSVDVLLNVQGADYERIITLNKMDWFYCAALMLNSFTHAGYAAIVHCYMGMSRSASVVLMSHILHDECNDCMRSSVSHYLDDLTNDRNCVDIKSHFYSSIINIHAQKMTKTYAEDPLVQETTMLAVAKAQSV
jgi:hypothetical protein